MSDLESQRLLLALKQARTKLEDIKQQQTEPIAIVGIGCRFPGGINNPESYWNFLRDGVDAIREIPPQRWDIDAYYDANPDIPGKMYTRYGGFLEDVDKFDPQFFGISPREATSMDPQQRLLLEVTWEALENAGLAPESLKNSQTGSFVGICFDDYSRLSFNSGDYSSIDAYSSLGNARSIAVGRLAYTMGWLGPTMQLDTACSSSLLGVHLACQSLRNRECNLAVAGGVNLILSPETSIALCKLTALATDGRCKTFDASANGYVRGEGCGIVVLKRLSEALAEGNRIYALIRGSAVNHDGHSNGLTAPNGNAQEALIRQALNNARVEPSQIQYLEAHGTGTTLGDPIEVLALGKVLGEGRSQQQPLSIGSVKTNFGHLESAAGIASLIKVVLAMQHQQIPPSLNFHQPNPYIPWDKLPVTVATELSDWKSTEKGRFAGVSAFGMSGTNVHAILEAAPQASQKQREIERPLNLLALSAKSDKALLRLAQRYQEFFNNHPHALIADICFTANTGRSHFDHRLALVAESTIELCEQLEGFISEQDNPGLIKGQVNIKESPKIAFLFTSQGSQYINMGRELYETQPTFRQALHSCDEILRPDLQQSLLEILYPASVIDAAKIDETAYTQPAIFAIEYALYQLWKSWGVEPDIVMGHSVGEYVAACVAGVFSLSDGLKLIAARGRLMQALPPQGKMVAVFADEMQVMAEIAAQKNVSIAAINSRNNTVISGDSKAVNAVVTALEARGIKTTQLNVSHAFHSPLMEPILEDFADIARNITYCEPQIKLVSNVTNQLASSEITTPQYWVNHISQPVRFAASMEALGELGYQVFVECGAKPILLGMGRHCLSADSHVWVPSLHPGISDSQQMLQSLGKLYVNGVSVNWSGFDRDYQREVLELPTYPFERESYWITGLKEEKNRSEKCVLGVSCHLLSPSVATFQERGAEGAEERNKEEVELQFLQELQQTIFSERFNLLITHIQNQVARVLGMNSLPVAQTGFFDMGMDSLMAVELKRRLESSLKQSLSTTLAFNYPTIEKLAEYLLTKIFSEELEVNSKGINNAKSRKLDDCAITQSNLEQLSEAETEALLLKKLAVLEA